MLEGKRLNELKMRRRKKKERKKKKKKKEAQNPSMTSLPSDSWERVH